ncbi:hypothetical protein HJC23_003908 [Cyclotella cryptica]|uniref:JmjC domain-containing protein n=1 Tax=Cyclotella cryptica TaxID=29204 RepID=A0ABD3PHU9_9STRA
MIFVSHHWLILFIMLHMFLKSPGWNPPFALNINCPKRFQTKDQSIHRLQEGISFGDGKAYTVKEYQEMATEWSKDWRRRRYDAAKPDSQSSPATTTTSNPSHDSSASTRTSSDVSNDTLQSPPTRTMTPSALERDYWEIVEGQSQEIDVDYGNDVDTTELGSGFPISDWGRCVNSPNFLSTPNTATNGEGGEEPEPKFGTEQYYKETYWNLNNIPNSKNSVLRHVKVGINGINVPWLYFGCLFSTFCWHNEDNYMYSINYHHRGAPKQWYGVPGTKSDADGVERVFKNYLSVKLRDVPDLMHHITTFFSPRILYQEGVKVCKLLQNEGEFIVTFPRSFHGGYSLGPNCGEAVNFALHDWIPHAVDANERYRTFARPSVFSHDRLIYTIAHHTNELRTKEICDAVSMELRRLMGEELLLRTKLIRSGVRDVSQDVDLPPNRLDQLDEESADYDDKRLCHSCKHICFFSAVACECSESKVSCLRHSHYMCRCVVKRRYLLIWTTEQEMKDTISRVEKRAEEVGYANSAVSAGSSQVPKAPLEDAPGTEKDRAHHCTYEVPVDPICSLEPEVPTLISSDVSCSSSGSKDVPSLKDESAQPQQDLGKTSGTYPSTLSTKQDTTDVSGSNKSANVNNSCDSEGVEPLEGYPSTSDDGELTKDANREMQKAQIDVIFKPSDMTSTGVKQEDGNDSLDASSDDFSA